MFMALWPFRTRQNKTEPKQNRSRTEQQKTIHNISSIALAPPPVPRHSFNHFVNDVWLSILNARSLLLLISQLILRSPSLSLSLSSPLSLPLCSSSLQLIFQRCSIPPRPAPQPTSSTHGNKTLAPWHLSSLTNHALGPATACAAADADADADAKADRNADSSAHPSASCIPNHSRSSRYKSLSYNCFWVQNKCSCPRVRTIVKSLRDFFCYRYDRNLWRIIADHRSIHGSSEVLTVRKVIEINSRKCGNILWYVSQAKDR